MGIPDAWIASLEARHLADLRFAEVARALRALSSTYVERRSRLPDGAALAGAGKRAAFALFYGPLHYLAVQAIVDALGAALPRGAPLVDLGCGTGAAGAAWASALGARAPVVAIDRSGWALDEAKWTFRHCGLTARLRRGDFVETRWPPGPAAFLAACAVNELPPPSRARLLTRLAARAASGQPVLVVEPLARGVAPWWPEWTRALAALGGRADEWRFRVDLPPIVARLDRAAGLDHRELKARSILAPSPR
jgi:hypothetical protein